jgi:GntR family transcriptional repressor for pyruvate dehydrogenase complex
MYGTFKRDSLSEQIAARLLSLIREKKLHPGDRLPPERDLAAMMKVSRPSLREALRALSIMNLIEVRQGDGTYVSTLRPAELLVEHLDLIFALEDTTYLELFEARKSMEVGIVALAAQRITPGEIAELEACLNDARSNMEDTEAFLQADVKLHSLITKAACNAILSSFMEAISRLSDASRHRTVELPGVPSQTIEDHRAIVAALKAHDPEAARQAMLTHLNNVQQKLKSVVNPDGNLASKDDPRPSERQDGQEA